MAPKNRPKLPVFKTNEEKFNYYKNVIERSGYPPTPTEKSLLGAGRPDEGLRDVVRAILYIQEKGGAQMQLEDWLEGADNDREVFNRWFPDRARQFRERSIVTSAAAAAQLPQPRKPRFGVKTARRPHSPTMTEIIGGIPTSTNGSVYLTESMVHRWYVNQNNTASSAKKM